MFGLERRRGRRERGLAAVEGAPVWKRVAGGKNGSQSKKWSGGVGACGGR